MADSPLIVALDTDDPDRLRQLADQVGPHVGLVKVGLQAYTALGPAAVAAAREHAEVFLDLKLHDIPNTVAGAAAAVADLGVAMLTVHASGGASMISAAVKGAPDVTILAVTILTSLDDADLAAMGQPPASEQVPRLAALAAEAGAGGIVCSPAEVAAVRAAVGRDLAVVVPGIRLAAAAGSMAPGVAVATGSGIRIGSGADDQARTATPAAAMADGASHLVIGRPITGAADPAAACRQILQEIDAT